MKKVVALGLTAVCLMGSGCSSFWNPPPHTHEFEVVQTTATCVLDGVSLMRCACGAEEVMGTPAFGHDFAENSDSPSRLRPCKRTGCDFGALAKSDGTALSQYQPNFTQADKEKLDGQYAALLQDLEEAGEYREGEHGYVEGSALDVRYKAMKTQYDEYGKGVSGLGKQYQYGQIQYHVHMDEERSAYYRWVHATYLTYYGYYSGLYQKLYDSAYREYFYHGKSEAEIQKILDKSSPYSDPEIVRLRNENEEYTVKLLEAADADNDPAVLDWYQAFVENNNEIAVRNGYENYMEYAYAEVYSREYTHAQTDDFYDYVKRYLSPVYLFYDEEYRRLWAEQYTDEEKRQYNAINVYSFFENVFSNEKVNDFLGLLTMKKKDGSDHSLGKSMENLMEKSNFFLGNYQGAYSWRIEATNTPIVYFGKGYQDAFTVVHEFGHYTNYVYNPGYSSKQSYDLAETHSQGAEMLFLQYLKGEMEGKAYRLLKNSAIRQSLRTILYSVSVNKFEQAVYTGEYDGKNSEIFLADNQITKDEYDDLYTSILEDLGILGMVLPTYWRHVTIPSAGYYISYAISMACSMQLYSKAEKEGLESAIAGYLQTMTYTVEHPTWNYKEILQGAGLYAYDEEQMFKDMQAYLMPNE